MAGKRKAPPPRLSVNSNVVSAIFKVDKDSTSDNKFIASILKKSQSLARESHTAAHKSEIQNKFVAHSLSHAIVCDIPDERIKAAIMKRVAMARRLNSAAVSKYRQLDATYRAQRPAFEPYVPVDDGAVWDEFRSGVSPEAAVITSRVALGGRRGCTALTAQRPARVGVDYQATVPAMLVDAPFESRHQRGDWLATDRDERARSWTLYDSKLLVADPAGDLRLRHTLKQFSDTEKAIFIKRHTSRPKNWTHIAEGLTGRSREDCVAMYYRAKGTAFGAKLRAAEVEHYRIKHRRHASLNQAMLMQSIAGQTGGMRLPRELMNLVGGQSVVSFDSFMETKRRSGKTGD